MKINKFNESEEGMNIAEMLSEKFFKSSLNFDGEKFEKKHNQKGLRVFAILKFQFAQLNIYDLETILEFKNYIEINNFSHFYVSAESTGVSLSLTLTESQYNELKEKLELDLDSKKYNL
jgi:hypothetical protein